MAAINLPPDFLLEMEHLMETEEEYQAFLESYQKKRAYGLRRNPLRYDREEFERKMPFKLRPIPWTKEGYYYEPEEQPGKNPYHEAGDYYIQEPSAMAVVELLDPKPGEYICDLCAAPGGKSSQIAGRLMGQGLLVSNEYVPKRAQILAQNMERMGVPNCVILNEDTVKLSQRFPGFFDRIVIDAPCSGEGMFRKDETAIENWSLQNVDLCAKRQMEILENGAGMLKPGGILVYSTCTFSEKEDEQVIPFDVECLLCNILIPFMVHDPEHDPVFYIFKPCSFHPFHHDIHILLFHVFFSLLINPSHPILLLRAATVLLL